MLTNLMCCPFCGDIPHQLKIGEKSYIECVNDNCLIRPLTRAYHNADYAVEVWNTRKSGESNKSSKRQKAAPIVEQIYTEHI